MIFKYIRERTLGRNYFLAAVVVKFSHRYYCGETTSIHHVLLLPPWILSSFDNGFGIFVQCHFVFKPVMIPRRVICFENQTHTETPENSYWGETISMQPL